MPSINVIEVEGAGASIGHIAYASHGMVTDLGIVSVVTGNLLYVTSGDQTGWVHDHDVSMTKSHASAFWGWPTGVDCKPKDRVTEFPNGFVANMNSITGCTYNNGTSTTTVTR